jgi:DeoR/GlpR family transcriptional regulator of sugar metabolism
MMDDTKASENTVNEIDEIEEAEALLPSERQQRILELVREQVAVRVSYLSELLNVSEMTIRRDLDLLENQGLLERTHGGAVCRQDRIFEESLYQSRLLTHSEERLSVAQKAASLIEANDTIFIGAGTATAQILRYLDPTLQVRIYTNNLGVLSEMQESAAKIVFTGGTYETASFSLVGPIAVDMIQQVYATKTFLAVDGLSLKAGLTTVTLEDAMISRTMIRHTQGQIIVLAEHDKFGRVAEMVIAPVERADIVIVDWNISDIYREQLESVGLRIMITRQAD